MISVITPVYNASRFLNKTIESVLSQPDVKEHFLIDDGSTDDSWKIIEEWEKKDNRIIALQHSDKKNHGRSATRNIGIKAATQKYIAFLDADDFYLSKRFENDLKILRDDESVDGVYNAVGSFLYDDFIGDESVAKSMYTFEEKIDPNLLFEALKPLGSKGFFSGDGLTVRKTVFNDVGYFNESLVVAEDTELWSKLTLKKKLVPGELKQPVTLRGVHGNNVFLNNSLYRIEYYKMFDSLFHWSIKNNVSKTRIILIWNQRKQYQKYNFPFIKGEVLILKRTFFEIIKYPWLINNKKVQSQLIQSLKHIIKKII